MITLQVLLMHYDNSCANKCFPVEMQFSSAIQIISFMHKVHNNL